MVKAPAWWLTVVGRAVTISGSRAWEARVLWGRKLWGRRRKKRLL
ncbi:hypothetical protein COLO4_09017 [Corchorus olitorius]|uniref:Uncharacterized protein n=1 Tax=Corchorus olitorius TaxID=93759 RepID=A0A1R3KDJ7_9ROSI|nr:hypothetical protein COLO4_09017 [Corchorus olitorius]